MRRTLVVSISISILLFFISSMAYSWGGATHAYIADQIGKGAGLKNQNEIYGAMAPDIFNFMFGTPYAGYLYDQTHGIPSGEENFMNMWESAKRCGFQKSLAYGFVSHNNVWGADSTAHWMALVTNPPAEFPDDLPPGYVIFKAFELESLLSFYGVFGSIGLGGADNYPIRLELCHTIVEVAGDFLIARADPYIGLKIYSSALLRDQRFPLLLKEAYAHDFSKEFHIPCSEAIKIIVSQENEFRRSTILMGYMLMQDENTAIGLISEQYASLMLSYLEDFGISIQGFTPEMAKPIIEQAIQVTLYSGMLDDYMTEINATINHVAEQLNEHGISY
ncbi:MAG: zinc dependent phospholipase C family protein [bacterium]